MAAKFVIHLPHICSICIMLYIFSNQSHCILPKYRRIRRIVTSTARFSDPPRTIHWQNFRILLDKPCRWCCGRRAKMILMPLSRNLSTALSRIVKSKTPIDGLNQSPIEFPDSHPFNTIVFQYLDMFIPHTLTPMLWIIICTIYMHTKAPFCVCITVDIVIGNVTGTVTI